MKGKETSSSVQALFETCGLKFFLEKGCAQPVQYNGQDYRLRHFIMGDHMMMYKVTGGHGPSSTHGWFATCIHVAAQLIFIVWVVQHPHPVIGV